jgi:hypothetical protein
MARQLLSSCAWSLLTLSVLCGVAKADPIQELRNAYIELYGNGAQRNLLSVLGQQFETIDFDGDGIEKDEIVLAELLLKMRARSGYVSQWLNFDLDGDMRVSKPEAEKAISHQEGRFQMKTSDPKAKQQLRDQLDKRIAQMFIADGDGNGFVEKQELQLSHLGTSYEMELVQRGRDPLGFAKALLNADPNSDGVITQLEAASLMGTALLDIEKEAARKIEAARSVGVQVGQLPCTALNVAKNTELVFVGAHEGAAAPTVTLAGQDEETSAASLVIEDGDKPLTLLLANHTPMIWKISGNIKRVQQVIAVGPTDRKNSKHILVGVAGIDKTKVLITGLHCVPSSYDLKDGKLEQVKEIISDSLGKAPEVLLGAYSVQDAQIPSGKGILDRVRKGYLGMRFVEGDKEVAFDANGKRVLVPYVDESTKLSQDEQELLDEIPGGVIQLKPSDVVAIGNVENYEVLPKVAGIQQLQREGKLARVKKDNCGGWLVKSKIRFPSGMYGGYSKVFLVPKGVPKPEGQQGHSSVYFQGSKDLNRYALCFD